MHSPRTILFRTVAEDDPARLSAVLLSHGLGPSHALDSGGNSLLHVAVTYGASAVLALLLDERADVNSTDAGGMTPLHLASTEGAGDAVSALLAGSADVSATTIDRLVRLGRLPIYMCGGRSPLHLASSPHVASLLLAARADAESRDEDGNTAWDVAVRDGHRPRSEVAAILCPGVLLPDEGTRVDLKREDERNRALRITILDVRQRMAEESDSVESFSDPGSSCAGDDSIPDSPFPLADAGEKQFPAPDVTCGLGNVSFAPPPPGLRVDWGPNVGRVVSNAVIWSPGAADIEEAVDPFTAPSGGSCILLSSLAADEVLGVCSKEGLEQLQKSLLNVPPEAFAWSYCGHQLGSFSGQLGDGAALCARVAGSFWEIHWKGAGRTPFSRLGTTGRKDFGSCVRELLLSEALAALGVCTLRGLAVFRGPQDLTAGDGPTKQEMGLLVRACPVGMLRFGSFDLANTAELDRRNGRPGPAPGNCDLVKSLVSMTANSEEENASANLLRAACRNTAALAARWAALGFVHGMLNTDNCHALGVAIDVASGQFLGPTDLRDDARGPSAARGRYSYRRQPGAFAWGLRKLAVALSDGAGLLSASEAAEIAATFPRAYRVHWLREMRAKLGLTGCKGEGEDVRLVRQLLHIMDATCSDFTSTFLALALPTPQNGEAMLDRLSALGFPALSPAARARLLRERATRARPAESQDLLKRCLSDDGRSARRASARLAKHEEADQLDAEADMAELAAPEAFRQADAAWWTPWLSEYGRRCASQGGADGAAMARANPRLVPRPGVVDAAVAAAEGGDCTLASRLLDLMPRAFDPQADFSELVVGSLSAIDG